MSQKQTRPQEALIECRDLKVFYPVRSGVFMRTSGYVKAVDGVNLTLRTAEIVSIVGESGCGKSSLGNAILGLAPIQSGTLSLDQHSIDTSKKSAFNEHSIRRNFQYIFQDPYSSLNPRHTIFEIIAEPLIFHKVCKAREARDKVARLLAQCGLEEDYMDRYPHSFSGGQRQRIAIARAIGLEPKAIICDEIVAALDVSVQAQIVNLLLELREELGLALLFISHDLSLVRYLSDRVYVMYLGEIIEQGKVEAVFNNPRHHYTRALMDSVPGLEVGKRPRIISGEVPSPANKPAGCAFASRCQSRQPQCADEQPELRSTENAGQFTHQYACHYPLATTSTGNPQDR
ncbi:MAG: ATP-binding cassette domain-containing protein [Leptospiraceae bacterium]|nr:ATP-binding cassette domain-containing protein [Leptospiraceae bacterium]